MAESLPVIRAQLTDEREHLRVLSDTVFDQIRERRNAGASLDALESLVVLHGHVVEAINALSKALRSGETGADG